MATWLVAGILFVVSAAAYVLFAGEVSLTEAAAGLPAACLAATFGALLHRGQQRVLLLRGPWLRILLAPLAALPGDSLRVGGVLLRAIAGGAGGTLDRQPFRPGGDQPREAGRRALVTLASSFAPNGYVVDIAPSTLLGEAPVLVMHRLAPSPPPGDAEWPV